MATSASSAAFRSLLEATVGGACGGAFVGLVEAGLITATSGAPEEYWLFAYAVVSYGLAGAVCGLGCVALVAVTRVRNAGLNALGGAAAAAVFLLGTAVLRYHLILRVFHEELVSFSLTGFAVHAGILASTAACAGLIMYVGRVLERYPYGLLAAATWLMLSVVVSSVGAVLASAHAVAPGAARATGTAAQGRPNIILIIVDTLRADAVGVYGAGPQATPALDRFARDAVRFEHTHSQASWTRPSIATILTSLYPSMHGAVHKLDILPDRVTTLAEALRADGYWTAGFVSNINVAPVFNFQQGYAEYTYLAPAFYFWATDSATRLAIYKGLRVARERLFGDRIYFYNYYQDAQIVERAVANWLDGHPPTPFFLVIHYMDPHDPYFEIPYDGKGIARVAMPNPPVAERDRLHALYSGEVTYLDQSLGTLFDHLKSVGFYDNSVIAITADHGEEFQEHGGWWHGTTLYEEQVHVPLLIKRVHEPRAGEVDSQMARSVDIAPTLMASARLQRIPEFIGRDLFESAATPAPPLFAEEDLEGNVLASLRVGAWKLITANTGNPRGLAPVELYDLDTDPHEHHNLASAEPGRVAELLQKLAQERMRASRSLDPAGTT